MSLGGHRVGWLALVVTLGGARGTGGVRNLNQFPACITDSDCAEDAGFKCFQYMCYPWNRTQLKGPFRSCKRRSDCVQLGEQEGGDGGDGDCYRHQDRRNVFTGVCLAKREIKGCFEHNECQSGLQCVNQVCGDPSYLPAIKDLGCQKDHECKDLLLGEHCCFDISGGLTGRYSDDGATGLRHFSTDSVKTEWGKKCCNNPQSPVIAPTGNITDQQIDKLNIRIRDSFSKLQLDQLICQALDYSLMMKLQSCNQYRTTTTTTTTVKPKTTTKKITRDNKISGSPHFIPCWSSFLLLLLSLTGS